MPTGYTQIQKVVTVANVDATINAEIDIQNAAEWMVMSITLSGTDVILLFVQTLITPP